MIQHFAVNILTISRFFSYLFNFDQQEFDEP